MHWLPTVLTTVGAVLVVIGGVLGEFQKRTTESRARALAEQSRDLANASLVRADQVIDNLTSRGSYPTMHAFIGGGSITFAVEVIGGYPLRGVSMRLKEITNLPLGKQIHPRDLAKSLKEGQIELAWSDGGVLIPDIVGILAKIPEEYEWEAPRRFVLDVLCEAGSFHVLTTLTHSEDGVYSGECVTTRRDSDKEKHDREQHTHNLAPNMQAPISGEQSAQADRKG